MMNSAIAERVFRCTMQSLGTAWTEAVSYNLDNVSTYYITARFIKKIAVLQWHIARAPGGLCEIAGSRRG